MDREEINSAKVLQTLSTTFKKNGPAGDLAGSKKIKEEYQEFHPQAAVRRSLGRGRKNPGPLKLKTTEQVPAASVKEYKNQAQRKTCRSSASFSNSQPPPRKQPRKGNNPVRLRPYPDSGYVKTEFCKNSICKAALGSDDTYCKRCCCCICHLFDDNKDPSLWLACTSEFSDIDSCGMVCHLECALQRGKAGVVKVGPSMQLDGSYCCASCGKVSRIIGIWKKQLMVAKEARRVDVLCHRVLLSHWILQGTSAFKELHEIVDDARRKLESELGPLYEVSSKLGRAIASRLSVCSDVQELCSLAIEKADTLLNSDFRGNLHHKACNFEFEDVTSTSLVVVLQETALASDTIKGCRIWYCKAVELPHQQEPAFTCANNERRFQIPDLQPGTEYAFRIVSFTEEGNFGLSEDRCFTKSLGIVNKRCNAAGPTNAKNENVEVEGSSSNAEREANTAGFSDFNVPDVGKILDVTQAQEDDQSDGFITADVIECDYGSLKPETKHASLSCELDLNVELVPDLNVEVIPTLESSRDEEDNKYVSEPVAEAGKDTHFDMLGINGEVKSNGRDSARKTGKVPAVQSRIQLCGKRATEEAHNGDSTLMNFTSYMSDGINHLNETYELCLKTIRCLERDGHVKLDFRVKFFTWLSLFSTEQERRVVRTFIRTLKDDPASLAGQLVDSFGDIILRKRPRNGCHETLCQ